MVKEGDVIENSGEIFKQLDMEFTNLTWNLSFYAAAKLNTNTENRYNLTFSWHKFSFLVLKR